MLPFEMKEVKKIGVTVVCVSVKRETNKHYGKVDRKYIETDTLLGATRIINTFKPKRGYEVVKVEIEEVGVLV